MNWGGEVGNIINQNFLTDAETGQIIRRGWYSFESHYNKEKGYKYKNETGIKFVSTDVPNELTDAELGKLFRLSQSMLINSNLLIVRTTNGKARPITTEDLEQLLSFSRSTLFRFLRKCRDLKVLKSVMVEEETHYYLSPVYFFRGKWLSPNLYWLFQEELDGILPEKAIRFFHEIK
jgi:hypothetical protein